jgi:plastocyanin
MRGWVMQFARIVVATAFLVCWTEVAGAATVVVNLMGTSFSPSDVTVSVGDTVQWVWVSGGTHTSTSFDSLWDSGFLPTGSTFEYTFNQPGDFNYFCRVHLSCCNMEGVVHVSAPTNPAAQLVVSGPSSATAGSPFDVAVTAVDSNGNIVPSYTGTVAFSSTDPFPAMLPANYTFTASDQGMHTFSGGVTLLTAGTQTLTVQDTANGSITGSASITVSAGATTQLVVSAAASAVAGSPFDVTVRVLDSDGNVVTGYSGTVTISSSDPFPGVLPADYTFTSSDQGTHTFPGGVTLFTAGGQTLTAQDTANSSLTGSAVVAVVAAPASQLLITAPATAVTGTLFDVTLTALDPYSNVDMNYGGTVTWTSSDTDPGVLLPADYTFQPTDNGMVTFSGGVTLITLGNQSITATDTVSGITGTAAVAVGSGP